MKMSNINIGPRATVGAGSLVLYDTTLAQAAALGDLSLLMKGETLPCAQPLGRNSGPAGEAIVPNRALRCRTRTPLRSRFLWHYDFTELEFIKSG